MEHSALNGELSVGVLRVSRPEKNCLRTRRYSRVGALHNEQLVSLCVEI